MPFPPRAQSDVHTADEVFETFDDHGRPCGLVSRSRAHKEGLWHRAANVFLFTADRRLLIQRRQHDKDVCPGAWDLSVAEHLTPGEGYEDGALRGLCEELGVERVELRKLGRISRACLEIAESGIKDREFQQSFAGTFDGAVNLNPAEVLEVRLIDLKELADAFVGQPHAFTPWYRQRVADLGLCAPWAAR